MSSPFQFLPRPSNTVIFSSLQNKNENRGTSWISDLLAEDWTTLGTAREMGEKTAKFVQTELKNTWGSAHLAVFSEEEAKNWVLGVSVLFLTERYKHDLVDAM